MINNPLKLFFSHYSPPARAALLVSKALNLDVALIEVDILSKAYLSSDLVKINPQHTIPTLQDGDFTIWDSHAIAGYLVSTYGKDDSLYPRDPKKRAIVDQRLYFDTEHLFPKLMGAAYPLLFRGKTFIPNNLQEQVKVSYGFLETFLNKSRWLAGDVMTIADLCTIPTITSLDYLVSIPSEHKNLWNFIDRCRQLSYYYESNQKGLDMLGKKIQERLTETYVRNLSITV